MASEQQGPTVMCQVEPSRFVALKYGCHTSLTILVAHLAFGMILGAFYALPPGR